SPNALAERHHYAGRLLRKCGRLFVCDFMIGSTAPGGGGSAHKFGRTDLDHVVVTPRDARTILRAENAGTTLEWWPQIRRSSRGRRCRSMWTKVAGLSAGATLGALAVVNFPTEARGQDATSALRDTVPQQDLAESLVSRREAALERAFDP